MLPRRPMRPSRHATTMMPHPYPRPYHHQQPQQQTQTQTQMQLQKFALNSKGHPKTCYSTIRTKTQGSARETVRAKTLVTQGSAQEMVRAKTLATQGSAQETQGSTQETQGTQESTQRSTWVLTIADNGCWGYCGVPEEVWRVGSCRVTGRAPWSLSQTQYA